MISTSESSAFLRACQVCSRKSARHLPAGDTPLLDSTLSTLAERVLGHAQGPLVSPSSPFTATIWQHGATHVGKTSPGTSFHGDFATLVKVLEQRAAQVVPKRSGWVLEPTSNKDGRRTNESTEAMHAVFLDADEAGEWDATLAGLDRASLAYLAYQSGGWSPAKPKWRIALPLSAPFDARGESARASWKTAYLMVRVLVGALGRLPCVGFDPATDGVACPWFLTERRHVDDPTRKVIFRPGKSLDLVKLALALPSIGDDVGEVHAPREVVARTPLAETRLEEIVAALVPVTSSVHSGRRDLYLALPGALLDRGLSPDDVVEICEAVSEAYAGGDAQKHADNVRSARCTAATWQRTGIVTRIGTLQATWPDVAKVVDEVLPDPWAQMLLKGMRGAMGIDEPTAPTPPDPPSISSYVDLVAAEKAALSAALPPIPPPPPVIQGAGGGVITTAQLRQIARKKRNTTSVQSKFDADILDNFTSGERLVSAADLGRFPQLAHLDGEEGLMRVAWILGNSVAQDVSWDAIVNVRPQASRVPFDRDVLARAGAKFEDAKKRRKVFTEKKEADKEAERASHRARVNAGVLIRRDGRP